MLAFEDMMNCIICCEDFNQEDQRPKILQCGHTYCMKCLLKLCASSSKSEIVCPTDRTVVPVSDPQLLPDNYSLLQALVANGGCSKPRFFCLECDQDATRKCIEEHAILSLKKARLNKVGDRLTSLKETCGAVILPKLLQQLDLVLQSSGLAGHALIDGAKTYLATVNKRRQVIFECFYKSLETPGPGWEVALKALEEESKTLVPPLCLLEEALEVLTIDEPEISVRGVRGGTWSGKLKKHYSDVELNLLRCLLLRLHTTGSLTRGNRADCPQEQVLLPLSDEDNPTSIYLKEEVLDLSHFLDDFGFVDHKEQLFQLLESKKKVRVLCGLGEYAEAGAKLFSQLSGVLSVQDSISQTLLRHSLSVEVVTLRTGCRDHLIQVLSFPNLRKLSISCAEWRCPCNVCDSSVVSDGPGCSAVQSAVLDVGEEWCKLVLQNGRASLQEVVLHGVPVPREESAVTDWLWLQDCVRACSALKSLTLFRSLLCFDAPACAAQLASLQDGALTRLTTRCASCQQLAPAI